MFVIDADAGIVVQWSDNNNQVSYYIDFDVFANEIYWLFKNSDLDEATYVSRFTLPNFDRYLNLAIVRYYPLAMIKVASD